MNQAEKDAIQTKRCNAIREYLRSIAITAVEAQDEIGNDRLFDLMNDIESDIKNALEQANAIAMGR